MPAACCGATAPADTIIPSITYGLAGTVYPHVDTYLNQAVDEYNAALHVPVTHLPPVPRRSVHTSAAPARSAPEAEQPAGRCARAHRVRARARAAKACAAAVHRGARERPRRAGDPHGRARARHDHPRRGFLGQPRLCAGDADCGALHGGGDGAAQAVHDGGRAARRSAASASARCAAICTTSAKTSSRS